MINRFLIPLGVFALLVVVLAIGIEHSPEKGIIASPLIGKQAPRFSLPSLTEPGKTVNTSDLSGRWYLFNVWGTWCGECRAEHQTLLQIRQADRIPVVGMDWRDDDTTAQSWLTQLGNPYDVIGVDHDGREAIDWGVYGAPETFLVNAQGVVVYKFVGALTPEVWEREILPRLPAATASAPKPAVVAGEPSRS